MALEEEQFVQMDQTLDKEQQYSEEFLMVTHQ